MARAVRAPADRFGEAELALISGLDRVTAERMILLGLSSYAEIAAWTAGDVQRWRDRLGLDGRISACGWIEQASLLAHGVETAYAARVRRGEIAALASRPAPEPPPIPSRARLPVSARGTSGPRPTPVHSEAPAAGQPVGSLMRRLNRLTPSKPVQTARRAAFTGTVEEATVEIVPHDSTTSKPR